MNTDEDGPKQAPAGTIYSEANFENVEQLVEKSVIDLFGVIDNNDKVISDIHFIGSLNHFNVPLIKNSWKHQHVDFLKLPPV